MNASSESGHTTPGGAEQVGRSSRPARSWKDSASRGARHEADRPPAAGTGSGRWPAAARAAGSGRWSAVHRAGGAPSAFWWTSTIASPWRSSLGGAIDRDRYQEKLVA
eukprot:scaffold75964_cov55-Phaeocystis_antarctica.AAC.3